MHRNNRRIRLSLWTSSLTSQRRYAFQSRFKRSLRVRDVANNHSLNMSGLFAAPSAPKLTFGLELEILFALQKEDYEAWYNTNPEIIYGPSTPPGTRYEESSAAPSTPGNEIRPGQSISQQSTPVRTREDVDMGGMEEFTAVTPSPTRARNGNQHVHWSEDVDMEDSTQSGPSGPSAPPTTPRRPPTEDSTSPLSTRSTVSTKSTHSGSFRLRSKLIMFLLRYLNRDLPFCKKEPSLLGVIEHGRTPKTADSGSWHLTYDNSVRASRNEFSKVIQTELKDVKKTFRCVGAELVSSVLELDPEIVWMPMLKQLEEDLLFNGRTGAWFTEEVEAHVHVHFGVQDDDITLELAQNVILLYGIWENEIEQWLKPEQRNSMWCRRVRQGMEKDRIIEVEGEPKMIPAARYTPGEFADRIYGATSLQELRSVVSGIDDPDLDGSIMDGDDSSSDHYVDQHPDRGWVTVNVSMKRKNKPTTIEFRHHHGTLNPQVLKWWTKFCGYLLKYAHSMKCINLRNNTSNDYLNTCWKDLSILDVIGFPEEGIRHFEEQKRLHYDEKWENIRAIEERFVDERIELIKLGANSGPDMDNQIKKRPWYKEALNRIGLLDADVCEGLSHAKVITIPARSLNRLARNIPGTIESTDQLTAAVTDWRNRSSNFEPKAWLDLMGQEARDPFVAGEETLVGPFDSRGRPPPRVRTTGTRTPSPPRADGRSRFRDRSPLRYRKP